MSVEHDPQLEKLLKAKDVAELFGIPESSVYEHARTNLLPVVRIGRRVRFRPRDIAAFMSNGGRALGGGWRQEPNA